MTEVLLFHHALGQTPGFLAFAERLREAGHTVHTPDLYEGRTFAELDAGVAFAEEVGFSEIIARGVAAAADLPEGIVYAGFSLGALPTQALTQTRPGATGALLFHSSVPTSEFGQPWPSGVPLHIHVMEADEWGDLEVGRALAEQIESAELYLYPGSGHLFADPGSPDYDPECARLLMDRTLAFLSRVP
jgi:dienelactone hydrolase